MNIDEILQDLYALDAGFRKHESALRNIIGDLIKIRPDVKLDDNFVRELRIKLLNKAAAEKNPGFADIFNYIRLLNRAPYVLGGAALVLAVALFAGVYFSIDSGKIATIPQNYGIAPKIEVTQLNEGAFGSLAALSASDEMSGLDRNYESTGQKSDIIDTSQAAPEPMPASSIAIAPDAVAYRYVYVGGPFEVPADKMPVYKKVDNPIALPFSNIISKFDFGAIDLTKFNSSQIENLTLAEGRQFGYIVNIDFKTGTISIYKNWEKWPQDPGICKGEVCMMDQNSYTLPPSELLSNTEIIKIADLFLQEYGIDVSGYGAGLVQDYGRYALKDSEASISMPYYSQEVTVVYPRIIDGKVVFDQSGNENGIRVGVDVRQKKVSYLYNLFVSKYESSLYATETSTDKILEAAQKSSWYYFGSRNANLEMSLGTPTLGMYIAWKYDQQLGRGYELYVPAFIFPILNPPEDFYQKNVVVPIVKEVFGSMFFPEPGPLPIPLFQDGVAE